MRTRKETKQIKLSEVKGVTELTKKSQKNISGGERTPKHQEVFDRILLLLGF